jgi:formylglycine-generating enzyme required for sulfatase activity
MTVRPFPFLVPIIFLVLCARVFSAEAPRKITGKDGAPMVLIPAGSFTMGAGGSSGLRPHKVYTDAFYMDAYEVTTELFAKFLNANKEKGNDGERLNWIVIRSDLLTEERKEGWPAEIIVEDGVYRAFPSFERNPVNSLSWFAAKAYCEWAGKRLPTEAEWEKAARGGLEGRIYPWGNEIPTGGVIFNLKWTDNRAMAPSEPVGNYHPNGYGLYDMAGNVWEWCYDWFDPDYYAKSPENNPRGPQNGTMKVLRGGSWFNSAYYLRLDLRNVADPNAMDAAVGFRCVMDADKAGELMND